MVANPVLRRAWLVVVLFVLLAGDAVRYTIGWWAYAVLALVLAASAIVVLVRARATWRWNRLPYPLLAFLALILVSITWSYYPATSALGVTTTIATAAVGVAIAVTTTWSALLDALGVVLRIVLGLSAVFELVVSLFVRGPVLPLVAQPGVDYAHLPEKIPPMLYWSRAELFEVFEGGRVQGILGNSVLLAFLAMLAVIVIAIQWAQRTVRPGWAVFWLVLASATLLATRSATITVALVACATVAAVVMALRGTQGRARLVVGGAITLVLVAAGSLAIVFSSSLLAALGKSEDLTGRLGIWQKVIELAEQRPAFGWGWVSYWAPWVAPFDDLVFRNGVRQLHAHNAWLDVWLQVGIAGLVVFGALVLSTLVRCVLIAFDRPHPELGDRASFSALSLLPLLVLTLLLVQSLAESRLLVEGAFALLVVLAVKSKDHDRVESAT